MEECYTVLGVRPTATAEEIEAAYFAAKRAADPALFPEGSEERKKNLELQAKLEKAYNDAIMATFGPVRVEPVAHSGTLVQAAVPQKASATPLKKLTPSDESDLELEKLVKERPISFSDEQLLSMSIDEIRGNVHQEKKRKAGIWGKMGIQDPLMGYYLNTFLVFVIFDFLGRVSLGPAWNGLSSHFAATMEAALPKGVSLPVALAAAPSPSVFWMILTSLISMSYLFLCSLVMPIVVRFLICGQPVERVTTRFMVSTLSIFAALLLYRLTHFLFLLLPSEWGGAPFNLAFIAPPLCWRTIKYNGV